MVLGGANAGRGEPRPYKTVLAIVPFKTERIRGRDCCVCV
jgi:hypothetical protein